MTRADSIPVYGIWLSNFLSTKVFLSSNASESPAGSEVLFMKPFERAWAQMSTKNQPATKHDLDELRRDLREFILEREVASIRWFVGTQIAYVVITLGAVYFMLSHLPK
jgi:hypothetical protein